MVRYAIIIDLIDNTPPGMIFRAEDAIQKPRGGHSNQRKKWWRRWKEISRRGLSVEGACISRRFLRSPPRRRENELKKSSKEVRMLPLSCVLRRMCMCKNPIREHGGVLCMYVQTPIHEYGGLMYTFSFVFSRSSSCACLAP